ncbi:hypothetical protein HZ996_01935 [Cryomorphaceae bacterium]|nr:hypothetical protein HZ996_01935 [Cryomorphaceae bacterium]
MSDRLKTLTDKIYHEGIEKAQEESARILEQAKKDAADLKAKSEQERRDLIAQTEREMESYRKKVMSEIRMSARKTANQIKKQLHELLVEKAIERPAKERLDDPEVMKDILSSAAGALTRDGSGGWKIEVSTELYSKIQPAVEATEHHMLREGVELRGSADIESGFVIREEAGQYKIVFDEATFTAFLGQFLKVETRNLLEE